MSDKIHRFELGKLTATIGVSDRMATDHDFWLFVSNTLNRFHNCDWGDLCAEDKALNEAAIRDGDRLMGAYIYEPDQTKIWIITEADRRCTTVLFPEEY